MRTSASLSNAIEQRKTKGRSWKSRVLRRGFLTSADLARLKSFVEFAMWKPKKNLGLAFYDRFPFVQLIIVWIGYHKTSQRNVKTFREIIQDIPHVHNDESRAQHKIKVALVTVAFRVLLMSSFSLSLASLFAHSKQHEKFSRHIRSLLDLRFPLARCSLPHYTSPPILSQLFRDSSRSLVPFRKKKHSVNAVVVIAKLLSKLQSTFFVFPPEKKRDSSEKQKPLRG